VRGVVGGRSVGGIYPRLAAMPLPWDKVHVFLADERLVPIDSDESNFKLVRGDLLAGPIETGAMPAANAPRGMLSGASRIRRSRSLPAPRRSCRR
jgi:6-phosphogluconolactonase